MLSDTLHFVMLNRIQSTIDFRLRTYAMAAILSAMLLTLHTGCGNGGGRTDPDTGGSGRPTAESLTLQGWIRYEEGAFEEGQSLFEKAIEQDDGYGDAHNGAGWSQLRIGSLASAVQSFHDASDAGMKTADPPAGRAVALRDIEPVDWQATFDAATIALNRDRRYVFSHDTLFNWRGLRLILAHSAFGLAQYDLANAQVDSLGGNIQNPFEDDFTRNLLAELERLGTSIRSR